MPDAMDVDAGEGAPKVEEEEHPSEVILPDWEIAELRWQLSLDASLVPNKEEVKAKLMEKIKANNMAPFYVTLCEEFQWKKDQSLLSSMETANKASLEKLEAKLTDAKENYGDTEIKDTLLSTAHHWCRIGHKEKAIEAYDVALEKTVGVGSKLDNLLTQVRVAYANGDWSLMDKQIGRAKEQLEKGGDWERKNKLLVYEAVLMIVNRQFAEAAKKLLDAVATFTATELLPFEAFVRFTVLMAMASCERKVLKEKVTVSPEVLQVVAEMPAVGEFVNSFTKCDYRLFMKSLIPVMDLVRADRLLHRHTLFLVRTYRLRGYFQFLEPFKSVTLNAMASSFGVSAPFIEEEVASFIASGKLDCKIDKVGGVVESNRPDARNHLYQQVIKNGDLLLNRLQKLSRVIDM